MDMESDGHFNDLSLGGKRTYFLVRKRFKAALYRLPDILQSLLSGIPLRMAARQCRTADDVPPFFRLFEGHLELHG